MLRQPDCPVTLQEVLDSHCHGNMPGLPQWSFDLDGNASFVTNRATGEHLHVDVCNGPDVMATGYFEEYVRKHRRPGPAERRLAELHPNGKGLLTSLHCLRRARFFHVIDGEDYGTFEFELCGRLNKFVKPVREFLRAWRDPGNRVVLATVIGDWPVVEELARARGDSALANSAAALSAESRRRWLNTVRVLADEGLPDGLFALANAGAEDLPEYLRAALDDSDLAGEAIEIAGDDASWRPQVYKLFRRLVERGSYIKAVAAEYLARHSHKADELISGLMKKPADTSAAILLALDHAPERLKEVLPRGLRSRTPWQRITAAAVLGLLDSIWSREVLLDVLRKSDAQDATIEARTALRESTSAAAHRAVDQWEAQHPEEGEPAVTTDRFMYRLDGGCQRALREKMLELNERVLPLRRMLAGKA
jgi:hypothetical protein